MIVIARDQRKCRDGIGRRGRRQALRTRGAGFTLIELLVVVAIIGVLMAVLLPMLGRARAQARQVKCATQLREYATGFQFYLSEYHDVFPAADYGIRQRVIQTPTWYQLIESYWRDGRVPDESTPPEERFCLGRCPELYDVHSNNDFEWEWNYSWNGFGYGYNRFWLGWNLFDYGTCAPEQTFWRRLSTVDCPSETVLVGDSGSRILPTYPYVGPVTHYVGWLCIASFGSGFDTRHGTASE